MEINGKNYTVVDVYDLSITVPDSFVLSDNKTCGGHGEAKLYMGSKSHMRKFYTGDMHNLGFESKCLILKKDIIHYMATIKHEYLHPSIRYRGQGKKKNMKHLWECRNKEIQDLPNVLSFVVKDQDQIDGERGYVKVTTNNSKAGGYGLIRKIALPFVSYISVMKLRDDITNEYVFYWKLFTDFSRMAEQQYAAKNYGKRKGKYRVKRDGQDKYRVKLYNQFQHCPFTQIDDIKLLIASHIKPWSVCNLAEKTDVENGLMLSPLFDKLFDKGYISFDNDGNLMISDWLSPANQERIDFTLNKEDLHLTDKRKMFLEYHRNNVFK